jgi:NAD(P)-dependent dehydrogenase (short-subunit alcohol dehydrogenase family)
MEKRKVIVTGASRGIGWEIVLKLAGQGHSILALARNEEKLTELARKAGKHCEALPFDITQADLSALEETLSRMGGVDLIINNAGALISKPFEDLADDEWQSIFEVNLFGVVRLLRTCLPLLRRSRNPHVLNISSMGGFQGSSKFPGLSAYSSSKGALSILSECLAEEWKEDGIRVNCLALGAVQTEMLAEAFPGFKAPLQSSEMAEFIAHFALTGHLFFNGKVLPVSVSTP